MSLDTALITADLGEQVFAAVLARPYSWHIQHNSSTTLGYLTKDVDQVFGSVQALLVVAVNLAIVLLLGGSLIALAPGVMLMVTLLSSDIRFWSSGDTKTGPPDGVLTGPFWGPLDLCFIGGCRFGVVVGGGNLCRLTGGLPQASSSGGVGRRPALSDEEEPPACGRIRPLRRFWRSR